MKINIQGNVDEWMLMDVEYIFNYIATKDEPIDLIINSLGGYVSVGMSIYSMLKRHEGKVTAYIDGFAGSMGSIIPLAADEIVMTPLGVVMIHDPLTLTAGNIKDHETTIEMLTKIKESMVTAYSQKLNKTTEEISAMMEKETWLSAKEAIEIGFADRMENDSSENSSEETENKSGLLASDNIALNVVAKLTDFKNVPDYIKNKFEINEETSSETQTKNGGLSSMSKENNTDGNVPASDSQNQTSGSDESQVNATANAAEITAKANADAQNRVTSIVSTFTASGLSGHAKMTELLTDTNAGELEAVKACNEILLAQSKEKPGVSLVEQELAANVEDSKELDTITAGSNVEETGSTLNMSAFAEGWNSVKASDTGE